MHALPIDFVSLPPQPPPLGEGRNALLVERWSLRYPGTTHRLSVVDLWAVECAHCHRPLNYAVRYDDLSPAKPAPRRCRECDMRRTYDCSELELLYCAGAVDLPTKVATAEDLWSVGLEHVDPAATARPGKPKRPETLLAAVAAYEAAKARYYELLIAAGNEALHNETAYTRADMLDAADRIRFFQDGAADDRRKAAIASQQSFRAIRQALSAVDYELNRRGRRH